MIEGMDFYLYRVNSDDILIINIAQVRFASFFSGNFTTVLLRFFMNRSLINPPERRLVKRTSEH